jgi:undecaprenyl-diphosphatase
MDFLGPVDQGTLYAIERLHHPWVTPVMKTVTWLGSGRFALAVLVAGTVGFLLTRRLRTAFALVFVGLVGLFLSRGLKYVVHRERPAVGWRLIDLPADSSFPSSHALTAAAVYGALAFLLARHLRGWRRWGVLALGFLLILLIGFSRLYLGVHYPIDVLAGWCAGFACALFGVWIDQFGDRPAGSDQAGQQ